MCKKNFRKTFQRLLGRIPRCFCDQLTFLEGKHYLVTVDCHSNFAETDQLSSTTTFAVIGKLKQHFARYGVPERVRTDNGPQFSSEEFHGFSQEWQLKHTTSSPGHPQSNGKAENAVGMVKQLFRKAMHSGRDVWQSLLDFGNTPTQGMTVSPAQRFLGRRTRTAFPIQYTLQSLSQTSQSMENNSKSNDSGRLLIITSTQDN